MTTTKRVYCPFCHSDKPMWRAGIRRELNGTEKQQYKCQVCHRQTVRPRKSKPRPKGGNG